MLQGRKTIVSEKYVYQVYKQHPAPSGTDGTRTFGLLTLSQEWPLQNLNANKSSGKSPTTNIDFVGVLDVVAAFILLQK